MKLKFAFLLFSVTILTTLLVISSCTKETPLETIDFGEKYFPIEIGKYWVYEVDSVIYDNINNFTVVDTGTFKLREEITTKITDNEGNDAFLVERSELRDPAVGWEVKDVWVAQRVDNQIHRVEENLRFIKLVFPVSNEITPWDGNVFIDKGTIISVAGESIVIFKNWLYEYAEIDEYKEIGAMAFDSTLTVIQANEENLIELRYSTETYAKGVGLIHKEMKILDTQCISACTNNTWEEKAETGFIYRQRIIDHN